MTTSQQTKIEHEVARDGLTTYVTNDYEMFVMLEENRFVNQPHVSRLIGEIKDHPESIKVRPILVNDKMEIIDGQHRLAALKELEYPVYYQVARGLDIDDTIRMNVYQRPWVPMDFALSYAGRGNEHYKRYIAYHDRFPTLTHDNIMRYCLGGEGSHISRDFRDGKFRIIDSHETIMARFKRLMDIEHFIPAHRKLDRPLYKGILTISQNPNYDHARMLEKLSYCADKYLNQSFGLIEDAQRALENAYNENSKKDRVRLF